MDVKIETMLAHSRGGVEYRDVEIETLKIAPLHSNGDVENNDDGDTGLPFAKDRKNTKEIWYLLV